MSDFGGPPRSSNLPPPPPPPPAPPPPFPPRIAPSPFTSWPSDRSTGAYASYGFVAAKPPRPQVRIGSIVLIVGSVLVVVASHLPWVRLGGFGGTSSINAFTNLQDGEAEAGYALVMFGFITGGLGVAQLAARRVLPCAIIAVSVAAFNVLGAAVSISDVGRFKRALDSLGVTTSWSIGPYVLVVGAVMALGGAIATLAKRRR